MVKCKESGSHAALETSGARSQVLSGKISSSWKLWEFQHWANVLVLTNKEQQNDLIYPLVMSK